MKKLNLRIFQKGLEEIEEFVNEHSLQPGDIALIVREGAGYKMLFWTSKPKPEAAPEPTEEVVEEIAPKPKKESIGEKIKKALTPKSKAKSKAKPKSKKK